MTVTTKVDQLPKLYLRGALFNITLVNLTSEQRRKLEDAIIEWSSAPELESIREGFKHQLRSTIGGEYADPDKAFGEFQIALTKSLCYLMYHTTYSIKCGHCNSKASDGKKYQRLLLVCPQCQHTKYKNKYVPISKIKADPKLCSSPFIATPSNNKAVKKSQTIMSDRLRMAKFITKVIKNYIRQTLKESKITRTEIEYPIDTATADVALASHIEYAMAKQNHNVSVIKDEKTIRIIHNIKNTTPYKIVEELKSLRLGYEAHGVITNIDDKYLTITVDPDLPIVNAVVKKSEVVKITTISNDPDSANSDSILFNSNGSVLDPHSIELNEAIDFIKGQLTPQALAIFEIFHNEGSAWEKFQARYGENEKPHLNKISDFLGCNANTVKSSLHLIRKLCYSSGLSRTEI